MRNVLPTLEECNEKQVLWTVAPDPAFVRDT